MYKLALLYGLLIIYRDFPSRLCYNKGRYVLERRCVRNSLSCLGEAYGLVAREIEGGYRH